MYVRSLIAAACTLSTALAAQSPARPDSPPPSEIVANGRGETRLTPDRATVLVTVESRAASAAAASSTNSGTTSAVVKALKAAAGPGDVITTESFMVSRDYGDKGKPTGFIARNSVRAQLASIERIGAIIDAGLSAGATQVMPVQFTGSKSTDARRVALKTAVIEARMDAEAMAEAAGGSLGKMLSLNSTVGGIPTRASYDMVVAASIASVEGDFAGKGQRMLPNDLTITAVVTGRWEFTPRRVP